MVNILTKLPGINSTNRLVKLLSYPIYGFLLLIVIAIVVPSTPTLEVYANSPTNMQAIEIIGKTRSGVPLTLIQNDQVILETTAASNGEYSFHLESLKEGEHTYTIESCEKKGSMYCTRQQTSLLVDHTSPQPPTVNELPPELTATKVTLTGEAESGSEIVVTNNETEHKGNANDDGKFFLEIPDLKNGKNELTTVAIDKAGNHSERVTVYTTVTIPESEKRYKVVKVVDGDTITLDNGQTLRYIGIDTPETVDPRKPIQCYGQEASAKNKELVEGKEVRLEKDVSETDKYGRILRYVYVGEIFVNDYLVRNGYARSSSYPPDIKHQDQFRQAEQEARENKRGLWSDACTPTPRPTTTSLSPATVNPTQHPTKSTNASCIGPDRDCGDFSTHAEAQAFFEMCGPGDPHGLDREKDGQACESLP